MIEMLQIWQLLLSTLIIPAAIYIIRLERRLATLNAKLDVIYNIIERREEQR